MSKDGVEEVRLHVFTETKKQFNVSRYHQWYNTKTLIAVQNLGNSERVYLTRAEAEKYMEKQLLAEQIVARLYKLNQFNIYRYLRQKTSDLQEVVQALDKLDVFQDVYDPSKEFNEN